MIRIGLDIGGTGIKLGLVNEQGQILRKSSIETRTDISFQEQVLAMVNATKALLDAQGVSLDDIHSIGAGVPGIADPRTGEVIFCTNLGWNHVPFRSTFQQYINKPVYIDNDATVAGLAESGAVRTASAAKWAMPSLNWTASPAPAAITAAWSVTALPPPSSAWPVNSWSIIRKAPS